MRSPAYEQVLAELEAGERNSIARKIFTLLSENPNGLTRERLVFLILDRVPQANINNDPGDRKIRETIASMRARLIPIVSNSGQAGYKLDDSSEARQIMLAEMISRRDRLNEQIQAASKSWQIPLSYREPEQVIQGRLM